MRIKRKKLWSKKINSKYWKQSKAKIIGIHGYIIKDIYPEIFFKEKM